MATKPSIGTMIRKARERKLMSQDDLARELRVSRSAVNAWENNRSRPRNRIGALEAVLDISLNGNGGSGRAEPESTPWEEWEASVLANRALPMDERRRLIADARAARDADDAARRARRQRRAEAEAEQQAEDRYRTGSAAG